MSEYLAAAKEAASAFGLAPERIEILSLSENVVCDLSMPTGEHLVMRLHRPGYNSLAELESEVEWVKALDASGLPVPKARPTTNGGYYTTVEVMGQTRYVGVVGWVTGQPLGSSAGVGSTTVSNYRRIGELCARIRSHHAGWTLPEGFTRRRWDVDTFLGDAPAWGRFWDVDALTDAQRDLFRQARSALTEELSSLPTESSHFGLIHADLHLGNVMTDGTELTVIDFDDAGFGWFAYELAVALHPMLDDDSYPAARRALLDGYQSIHPLEADEQSSIDTFLTLRSLIDVSWLDERRELPTLSALPGIIALAEQRATSYVEAAKS